MKNSEQPAFPPPEHAPYLSEEPTEDEQYRQHVASLFTAPFLTADALLENLAKYWPADAHENLHALVAAGYIELAPTGRYRLPLPAWKPADAPPLTQPTISVTAPVPLATRSVVVQPTPLPVAAPPVVQPRQPVAATPKLKPLRLAIAPVPSLPLR